MPPSLVMQFDQKSGARDASDVSSVVGFVDPVDHGNWRQSGSESADSGSTPSPAYAMAISPKRRRSRSRTPRKGVTRLYPKLLTERRLTGRENLKGVVPPTCLAHREMEGRGVFLIATQDDQTLHLLDDHTFAAVGEIKIKVGKFRSLAVPADPR
jgi:hypothetical protein